MVGIHTGGHIVKHICTVCRSGHVVGIAVFVRRNLGVALIELHSETGQALFVCILLAVVVGGDPCFTGDLAFGSMDICALSLHGLAKLIGTQTSRIDQCIIALHAIGVQINICRRRFVRAHSTHAHDGKRIGRYCIGKALAICTDSPCSLEPGDTENLTAVSGNGRTCQIPDALDRIGLDSSVRRIVELNVSPYSGLVRSQTQCYRLGLADADRRPIRELCAASIIVKGQHIQQQCAGQVIILCGHSQAVMHISILLNDGLLRHFAEAGYR